MSSQNAVPANVPKGVHKSRSTQSLKSESGRSDHGHGGSGIDVPVTWFFRKNDGVFGAKTGPRREMAKTTEVEHTEGFRAAHQPVQAGYEVEVSYDTHTGKLVADTASPVIGVCVPEDLPFHDPSHTFVIKYGDKSQLRAKEATKTISIGHNKAITVNDQFIGIGKMYKEPVKSGQLWTAMNQGGIMGLSPSDGSEAMIRKLSAGKNRKALNTPLPGGKRTLLHALHTKNNQPPIIGLHFFPYGYHTESKMVIGGYDKNLLIKEPIYTPILAAAQSGEAHGQWVMKSKVKMGTHVLTSANAIVDTGATQLTLPGDAYDDYITKSGAEYNQECDGFILNEEQFKALPDLHLTVYDSHGAEHDFVLTNDAQIWPKALSKQEKVPKDHYVLAAAPAGEGEELVIFAMPVGTCTILAI